MAIGAGELVLKLLASAAILSISLFWSSIVVVQLVYTGFRKGFGKVFNYVDRKKGPPPIHFEKWDEETRHNPGPDTKAWNHCYITVPKTGMRFHYVYSGKVPDHLTISDIDGETAVNGNTEDRDNQGPKLMICAHGFPENWFSWRHVLRAYDDQPEDCDQYFVVALDLRGYGDSDIPGKKDDYHIKCLADDIRGVVEAFGYEKCVFVGHDWGGVIGWAVVRWYPDILEKCIVMNAPHRMAYARGIRAKPKQILSSWYMFFFQIPFLPELTNRAGDYHAIVSALNGKRGGIVDPANRLTEEELEVFKYSFRRSSSGPINYYRATLWPFCQPGPPLRYPRQKIDGEPEHLVPILLIWGDKDEFMVKEIADLTKDYINPSNGSKVVFIHGASHWVQQDQPEKVIREMRDFLA